MVFISSICTTLIASCWGQDWSELGATIWWSINCRLDFKSCWAYVSQDDPPATLRNMASCFFTHMKHSKQMSGLRVAPSTTTHSCSATVAHITSDLVLSILKLLLRLSIFWIIPTFNSLLLLEFVVLSDFKLGQSYITWSKTRSESIQE